MGNVEMALDRIDWTVLGRFQFLVPPVGVKFLALPPDGMQPLAQNMAFCEMLKWAQGGNAFYAAAEHHTCEAGRYVLGQAQAVEHFINGEFGAGLRIFQEPRAASRLYEYIPKLGRGIVNYVAFSPLDQIAFDPDVLVLLANTTQTEILLRAMSYRTGEMWSSKYSSAIGCAWILIHPYLTGEMNNVMTGLGHGMRRRKLFPEGQQLVSIPFDRLPSLLQTLQEMPWVLPAFEPDGAEFVRQLLERLQTSHPKAD